MKQFTVELSSPIMIAGEHGSEVAASHIDFKEPTGKQAHLCGVIQAESSKAMMKFVEKLNPEEIRDAQQQAASEPSESDEVGFDAEQAAAVMVSLAGGGGDMSKIIITCKELFKEVAMVGSEKPMTAPMFDRMAYKDVQMCVGSYIQNFLQG